MKKTITTIIASIALGGLLHAEPTQGPPSKGPKIEVGPKTISQMTLAEIVADKSEFSSLAKALKVTGLDKTLGGDGPFTVFAPNNAAFERVPKDVVASLMTPEGKEKLTKILLYHVVPGKLLSTDVSSGKLVTAAKAPLEVKSGDGKVMINQANVLSTDTEGTNGVIHVIDTVLMPAE